jgi:integrase
MPTTVPGMTAEALTAEVVQLILDGVPDSTRRAYAADRNDYRAFAHAKQSDPLPATPELLAGYVTRLLLTGSMTVSSPRPLTAVTVERRLAAVSTWSVEQGHGKPDLRSARLVLRGHRRTVGEPRPAQAAPVMVENLRAMLAAAVRSGSPTRAARDRVLLLVSFALAARRSEVVSLDLEDLLVVPQGLLVRITRGKTRDHADVVPVLRAADLTLCPVLAVTAWRELLAVQGLHDGPLLRPVSRAGTILTRRLGAEAVSDVVRRLAEDAGLPVPAGYRSWSAHGLRRGCATEARRAGADAIKIARLGGWKDGSAALNRYLVDEDQWIAHALDGVL